jgi:hypothetical protein
MSKRERSISVRFTDEEFDRLNAEYQSRLAAVLDGLSFTLSDMVRIKTLRPDPAQGKQRESLSYGVSHRRTA